MAAFAALISLMHVLNRVQSETRLPLDIDKRLLGHLLDKVGFLIHFLENTSSKEVKSWESVIVKAAYTAEDFIESHVVNVITTSANQNSSVTSQAIEKVTGYMDVIKNELMKIKVEHLQITSVSTSDDFSRSRKTTMVGFDEESLQIMKWLFGEQSSRLVIPIVGMGGAGKSTLAKNVYDKPAIVHQFDIRSWVTISQDFSRRQILLKLLSNNKYEKDGPRVLETLNDVQLGERLYKIYFGRRYLVVMDDIWSLKAWEMVKSYFPDNCNHSRIIMTTRLSSIVAPFGSCRLQMNFLNEDKSWDLFCERVFAQEDCPFELQEVGRKIVKNCKGLPLSITVIGGLLKKSERTEGYWESVARNTNSVISSEDDEHCMHILSISYNSLPIHLKPCFLYMGVFPEDEEIRVSWLINLWVAEGILKPNSSEVLEVVGDEYLSDLVSRNLIYVHERGSTGKIKFCKIHDLMRDLSLREAHKENFLYVPNMANHGNVQCLSSQRRICIQSTLKEEYISDVLVTLKVESLARSLICDLNEVLPLRNFRLLRVFNMAEKGRRSTRGRYSLDDVFQLVNSRHITVDSDWNSTSMSFPSSLGLLWNIQTLIVQCASDETTAPMEIWEMTELKHIEFNNTFYLPDPPNQPSSGFLKKLHTLNGVKNFRCTKEAVMRLPNIKKLRLTFYTTGDLEEFCQKNLQLLEKLESLAFIIRGIGCRKRPEVLLYLPFPVSLKKLTLFATELYWEDMTKIASLPHLQVLKLKADAVVGKEWMPVEYDFPRLKFLLISGCDLEDWKAENTHFPCLEHLFLGGMHMEIPPGIGDIPTLQSIQLDYCGEAAVISAKNIQEELEDNGDCDLQVRVRFSGKNKFDNLAADNFRFETGESNRRWD